MAKPFRLFSNPKPKASDEAPPSHLIAITLRCEDDFLFDVTSRGPCPFMSRLETTEALPPTLGSEGLMLWVRDAAQMLGVPEESILSHDLRPPEPLQPFENVYIHLAILDVQRHEFNRIRLLRPDSTVFAANHIMQHVGQNFFFRPISETYRVPA